MAAPKRIWIIVAFAALYLIWGSTYLGILFAIQSIPPFLMDGARFFVAGAMMYAVARWQGAPRPTAVTWNNSLIIGACLLLGGNGAVTISEKWVPTGLAALLVATVPIYIALLGWLSGTAPRPTRSVWLGLFGGFVGVGILVGPALTSFSDRSHSHLALGMSILLFGSLLWSIGSLLLGAGQQMMCGGALLALLGLLLREHRSFDASRITLLSAVAFIYLVLIGAIIGYTAYFYLLRHCDPAKVATYAYVNPIVALFLGTWFAHEKLTLRTLIGAGLIIGSGAVVIMAQQMTNKDIPPIAAAAEPDCAT